MPKQPKPRPSKPGDERRTPKPFFLKLNQQYSFNLDVAADNFNHLCDHYYTKETDGLEQPWNLLDHTEETVKVPGRIWCNPPYSDMKRWILKAHEEFANGNAELIVMLLPADTSTKWFHENLMNGPHRLSFIWIKGRLSFQLPGQGVLPGAKFPSMLVVWDRAAGMHA